MLARLFGWRAAGVAQESLKHGELFTRAHAGIRTAVQVEPVQLAVGFAVIALSLVALALQFKHAIRDAPGEPSITLESSLQRFNETIWIERHPHAFSLCPRARVFKVAPRHNASESSVWRLTLWFVDWSPQRI